jgi:tripartite-type tricarboxylate transporter receptor subunit TctC
VYLAAGVAAALSSHGAWSQAARTIKVVTASPPGSVTDFLPRLLTEQISRAQGVTIVIENRPGAGGIIAAEAVSRAKPDGNTVLFMSNAFVINPHLRKVNYDPLTSFERLTCPTLTFADHRYQRHRYSRTLIPAPKPPARAS